MIVHISRDAYRDIQGIQTYIERDSKRQADRFIIQLLHACRDIARTPYLYALYRPNAYPTLRRKVYKNYLIFYSVQNDTLTIVRILHGARDVESVL